MSTSTFGSNTLAHFWVLKAFLPPMLRRGRGHIVTMSSILAIVGAAQMSRSSLLHPTNVFTDSARHMQLIIVQVKLQCSAYTKHYVLS